MIERLLALQDVDLKIMRMERECRDIPARQKEILARNESRRAQVEQTRKEIAGKKAQIKEVEIEVEARKQRIARLREQQMQLKTNKEFRAMEDEIRIVGEDIGVLETRQLELLDEEDALAGRLKEIERQLREEESAARQDVAEMENRKASLEATLGEAREKRRRLAADTDTEWRRRYEQILVNRGEAAIVAVDHGVCGGCHMTLPPQTAHNARNGQAMVVCDFCGRLLCPGN